jgi:hypothetical protein
VPLDQVTARPDRMRDFHDLDIHIEVGFRRTVMQGNGPVDTRDASDQRQQFRLTPHREPMRNFGKVREKPRELNGVTQTMVTSHQNSALSQLLTTPDTL